MDLKQVKLTKSEWESIEVPVSSQEMDVLHLIKKGYSNVNIRVNKTNSLFTYLKLEYSQQIEEFLYAKFFSERMKQLIDTLGLSFVKIEGDSKKKNNDKKATSVDETGNLIIGVSGLVRLKSGDQIRMSRIDNIPDDSDVYEIVMFKHFESMNKLKCQGNKLWMYHYYTLSKLNGNGVEKYNNIVKEIIDYFLKKYEDEVDLMHIVENSSEYIEKNKHLLKYSDMKLYDHQKDIFTAIKKQGPKLVLYIAPTGTGKTMTPLGLSEEYRVIFVCAARHVGLAFARAAISVGKKIAFAFGCPSPGDVKLHYFAAKEYTKDKRSGQIKKVDNSVGDDVEIIISDVRSYLAAMEYMKAFNRLDKMVMYWDEPTISMDYDDHELHQVIKKNWNLNRIPNIVLSSATLPKINELNETISNYQSLFLAHVEIINIVSHDCRKTIPLINNNGCPVMPYSVEDDYQKLQSVVQQCEENLTLMRYFDLKETSDFISFVEKNGLVPNKAKFERSFGSIDDVDMKNIKMHYLKALKSISAANWPVVSEHFKNHRNVRILLNNTVDDRGNKIGRTNSVQTASLAGAPLQRLVSAPLVSNVTNDAVEPKGNAGVYVSTKDAYTLTDGPTIFLAKDLQKIAKFCIQQSNIPASVMKDIMDKIEYNNKINERINEIEKELALEEEKIAAKLSGTGSSAAGAGKAKDKKSKAKIASGKVDLSLNKASDGAKMNQLKEQMNSLKSAIKRAALDDMFIPNKLAHISKWAQGLNTNKSFTSNIEDDTIVAIMSLGDVDDSWKILLLLGIGVFTEHRSITYTEIMKRLADQQRLYLIIADSDYIYGTNYQFCHGYISKDLELTQEKIIQALGRIGRNNIQQEYSARFRDDAALKLLYSHLRPEEKPEVINMNRLLNTRNLKWNGSDYEELPEEVYINPFAGCAQFGANDSDDDEGDDDNGGFNVDADDE